MGVVLSGARNPNWKGGRVVEPRGYVLIRVGKDHPLADVRGYAYEHRLKAYEAGRLKLGRKRIHVHHDDEDKGNNDIQNLEPLTPWQHRAQHRKSPVSTLRNPGERNPLVRCLCGCGKRLSRFDEYGRRRSFVSGHNPQPSPSKDAILGAIKSGLTRRAEIIVSTGLTSKAVASALDDLKRAGVLKNPSYGRWRL